MKGTFNAHNGWIDPGNKYIGDAITVLNQDLANSTLSHNELVDYIAASICIHCSNGWSYLSAAVASLLEGDYPNAVHNAYYAELRSIMSFLAMQGIGVFGSKNHILINSQGQAIRADSNASTHGFAKKAFDEWLSMPTNASLITQLLRIEGKPLQAWLQSNNFFQSSTLPTKLAVNWLNDWSIDLGILHTETDFRNFVSYRPQSFTLGYTRPSDDISVRLKFISELWDLCGPSGLFAHSILRKSLRDLYMSTYNRALADVDEATEWKPMFQNLGFNPDDSKSKYLIKFFKGELLPNDNVVFDKASNLFFVPPIQESDVDPMGIVSRASLLLLITTQSVDTMLRQTGLTKTDLQFWHNNIGIKSGYWDATTVPALFEDLWIDIEYELLDMGKWLNGNNNNISPYTFQQVRGQITHLHQVNRAYLWGTSGT
jgi:hypothetical protein